MPGAPLPYTTDTVEEYTGEQLALSTSQRVHATLRGSTLTGGRARNGAQIFLSESTNSPNLLPADNRQLAETSKVWRWTDTRVVSASKTFRTLCLCQDGQMQSHFRKISSMRSANTPKTDSIVHSRSASIPTVSGAEDCMALAKVTR